MAFIPAHTHIVARGAAPVHTVLLLHGILGSGRNWRGFARRLVERLPRWRVTLVDLRNHGDSGTGALPRPPPPHTLEACAADLERLGLALSAVIGHSYGGKVALAYARRAGTRLGQAWVLDATPGARPIDGEGASELAAVLRAIRRVALPAQHREQVVEALTGMGLSMPLARWMTTNLRRTDAGLVWKFDLEAIEEMWVDYLRTDFWPWLEGRYDRPEVHLVRATHSDRWNAAELHRFARLPAEAPVVLHEVAAGHWLHVDAPDALLGLLTSGLGASAG